MNIAGNRIDSPDNDSAFSDNASMLSSESSASGGSRKNNQANGTQHQVSLKLEIPSKKVVS